MSKCKTCKHWSPNWELEHSAKRYPKGPQAGDCQNKIIHASLTTWETDLPKWIKPRILSIFCTKWSFGCCAWEESTYWEDLWK